MGAMTDVGCYDVRGRDLRTYFGAFTRRHLPEDALCALSLASSALPDNHAGYMAWMTIISGTDLFAKQLGEWAIGLGTYIHSARFRRNRRFRAYCEGWRPEWGKRACLDGLILGLFGPNHVPGSHIRAEEFGISDNTYRKIRDFVGGATSLAAMQYEESIQWVMRRNLREHY
jgi:hypothetical protein